VLYFFDTGTTPISGQYLGNITLTKRSGGTTGSNPISVASGNGVLTVVGDDFEPQYITYDSTAGTFATNTIDIKIRDFIGIDDGLAVDEQTTTLTDSHHYNLLNQGWADATPRGITNFFSTTGYYPTNASIRAYGYYTDVTTGKRAWIATNIEKIESGTTPAPKGSYVISAFDRSPDRESASGITGLPTDVERGRPTAIAAAFGRFFYSGINSDRDSDDQKSPNMSGYIFFSPILTDITLSGNCYQAADPTSENVNDLVSTDGGTIQIPEANKILALVSLESSIVVVADNGAWELKGGQGGFTATDYSIRKITERGAINKESIVRVENTVLYWNEAGIYILTPSEITGYLQPRNLTEQTIQTYYNDISDISKSRATGVYDTLNRKVRWLYNTLSGYNGVNYKNSYNKELIFDFVLGAFYPHTITIPTLTVNPMVCGYTHTPSYSTETQTDDVVDGGVAVEDGGVQVQVTRSVKVGATPSVKYIVFTTASNDTTGNWRITLGEYNSTNFVDWYDLDSVGVDYTSYLETGTEILGDTSRRKQAVYVVTHFKPTETGVDSNGDVIGSSSCLIQGKWDYSNHANSGKFGTQFEAYRLNRMYTQALSTSPYDYGHSVITTKHKMRGSGKALSLRIESSSGKNMHLYGWNILYGINTKI